MAQTAAIGVNKITKPSWASSTCNIVIRSGNTAANVPQSTPIAANAARAGRDTRNVAKTDIDQLRRKRQSYPCLPRPASTAPTPGGQKAPKRRKILLVHRNGDFILSKPAIPR